MRAVEAAPEFAVFGVGDMVIRRREPKYRYDETPVRGEVMAIHGDRVRVRWIGSIQFAGGSRGNNGSTVRASVLLPATPENIRKAEEKLRGRKAQAWLDRAEFYEGMAATRERQGLPKEAEWMRSEASDARARASETGVS